jgi:small-conductance mechanosensitive channel
MFSTETWEQLQHQTLLFLPRLGVALVVLLVFWLLARGLGRVVRRLSNVRRLDPDLVSYLGRGASALLLLFGLVTALGTLGLDVTALVAGLGLTTFAIGFALKDILANAISGILVLVYRPFRVGDRVNVKSLEGTVVEINLRYTVLEAEGKRMLIPSSLLFSEPVTVVPKSAPPETPPKPSTPDTLPPP